MKNLKENISILVFGIGWFLMIIGILIMSSFVFLLVGIIMFLLGGFIFTKRKKRRLANRDN